MQTYKNSFTEKFKADDELRTIKVCMPILIINKHLKYV